MQKRAYYGLILEWFTAVRRRGGQNHETMREILESDLHMISFHTYESVPIISIRSLRFVGQDSAIH